MKQTTTDPSEETPRVWNKCLWGRQMVREAEQSKQWVSECERFLKSPEEHGASLWALARYTYVFKDKTHRPLGKLRSLFSPPNNIHSRVQVPPVILRNFIKFPLPGLKNPNIHKVHLPAA